MPKSPPILRTAILFAPFAVVSVIHLVALAIDLESLSPFTKPLLMLSLLAGLLFALPQWRTTLALLSALALLLSWAGDVGIASPGDLSFVVALVFFLLAHGAYIVLFWGTLRMRRFTRWSVLYAAWWIVFVVILAPHAGSLFVPIALYGLVLGGMGALALRGNRFLAVGGLLFVVSDSILGLNKFLPGFELWHVDFLIMITYIGAQGLLAWGIARWAWQNISVEAQSHAASAHGAE